MHNVITGAAIDRHTQAGPPPLFDAAEVVRALGILVEQGDVFEIRILDPRRAYASTPRVISGYFDDPEKVPPALEESQLSGAKGIYVVMNRINPALSAKANNKLQDAHAGELTADKDIVRRRWLLVDADPVRPPNISSTDEEKALAHERAQTVDDLLQEAGWPAPVVADSGNGYHLLYRVDLAADDQRVKRCLDALDKQFSDEGVHIDTTVANPSRIVKLYGTLAAKGDHDIGRPHRLSRMLSVPETIQVVTAEQFDAVSPQATPSNKLAAPPSRPKIEWGKARPWDRDRVQAFIDTHLANCQPGAAASYDGGFKWVLGCCPFNSEHTDRSACIVIKADGVLGFKCHHNGCKNNNWKALRAKFEPAFAPYVKPTALSRPPPVSTGEPDPLAEYGPPISVNAKGEPCDINQQYMAARFAQDNRILFDPGQNQFFCYDENTGLWRTKTEARVIVELGNAVRQLLQEWGCEQVLRKRTEHLLSQILSLLRGVAERQAVFHRKEDIIHVGNGVLDLSGGAPVLRPFSPDYYSRNRSEICYDPGATCPRFLTEFLGTALGEDDISLVQRYAGQCLLGRNISQTIMPLRGTPNGGKTTLANLLEGIIGVFNVAQLRVHHLTDRFELAGFTGKTLLSGRDVPGDFLDNDGAYVLKSLVGGDRLDAEQKNMKDRLPLMGNINIIMTTNTRLRVRLDTDAGAWRRRLLIIDYERAPTAKPIPNFDRILLEAEGPGILNWCIEGALKIIEEMNTYGKIQLTKAQAKRVDALLCESDSVRDFVTEAVAPSATGDITVAELQAAYHEYCETQGWQPVTGRQFENQVGDRMMEVHRVARRTDIPRNKKNQRGFSRVVLKATAQEDKPVAMPPHTVHTDDSESIPF